MDVAYTLAGVAVLVVLGKGIAALGQALSLPNACWQLLALRAAAGAAVIGSLAFAGRGSFLLFGVLYAAALMLSHSSLPVFLSVVLAGIATAGVARATNRYGSLRIYAMALTFVSVMSVGSLYGKLSRAEGLDGALAWGFDLAIRLAGAAAVVSIGLLLVGLVRKNMLAKD
jgi:hypothetical protein